MLAVQWLGRRVHGEAPVPFVSVVLQQQSVSPPPLVCAEYLRGWRVKTSPVPIKPPFFSLIKSNNYLPNALNLMDAQAEQYDQVGGCGGSGSRSSGSCFAQQGASWKKERARLGRGLRGASWVLSRAAVELGIAAEAGDHEPERPTQGASAFCVLPPCCRSLLPLAL